MRGSELRAIRLMTGLRQRAFAQRLGITRSALAHYEQGRARIPHPVAARALAFSRMLRQLVLAFDDVNRAAR